MSDLAGPGSDLPFSCRCGAVKGVIERAGPREGDFVVCHCTDCQTFANRFDAGDRVMGDQDAGTPLYQSRCARMRIESGRDRLRCIHLTEEATLRWYAGCCDTPLFNSYKNGKIPYVTTLVGNCDAGARARMLGEPIGHLFVDDDQVVVFENHDERNCLRPGQRRHRRLQSSSSSNMKPFFTMPQKKGEGEHE